MALNPITLTPAFVLDAETTLTGIIPDAVRLFEDRVEFYNLPAGAPIMIVAYDGSPYIDGGNVIKLSAPDSAAILAAVALLALKVKNRLENYPGP